MDKNIILKALYDALNLIQDESESVIDVELLERYMETLELLEVAIKNLEER